VCVCVQDELRHYMESMWSSDKSHLFISMSTTAQKEFMTRLSVIKRKDLCQALTLQQLPVALAVMLPQDVAIVLRELAPEERAAVLAAMSPEERAAALAAMSPEDDTLAKQVEVFKHAFVEVYEKWIHTEACLSEHNMTNKPFGAINLVENVVWASESVEEMPSEAVAHKLDTFKQAFIEVYQKWQVAHNLLNQLSPHDARMTNQPGVLETNNEIGMMESLVAVQPVAQRNPAQFYMLSQNDYQQEEMHLRRQVQSSLADSSQIQSLVISLKEVRTTQAHTEVELYHAKSSLTKTKTLLQEVVKQYSWLLDSVHGKEVRMATITQIHERAKETGLV